MLALLTLATGCGEQPDRSGCTWSHNSMDGHKGYAKVLQVDDEWRFEKDVGVDVRDGHYGLGGCTCMRFGSGGMLLWGCPLTPRTTQGGIGAAQRPRKKLRGGIGVPLDPRTNSERYWGRPRAPGENLWGYGGVP